MRIARRIGGAWLWVAVLGLLAFALAAWSWSWEGLPREIRIAAAEPGGLYAKIASALKPELEALTGRPVRLLDTQGSQENCHLLLQGEAELAILQAGSFPVAELASVAPLYREPVHLVVRKNRGIDRFQDLAGKTVLLGREASGMQASARMLLRYFELEEEIQRVPPAYFMELLERDSLDAAIITTGSLNPDLRHLLHQPEFALLEIPQGQAISTLHAFFTPMSISQGLYQGNPPVPDRDLPTVGTTSLLACRSDASGLLVEATLQALLETNIRLEFPTLLDQEAIRNWDLVPIHSAVPSYHDPYAGLTVLAAFMESLSGIKELLVALGMVALLLAQRLRKARERAKQEAFAEDKERLDALLDETVRIEQAQLDQADLATLRNYLDEVTQIKLRALQELSSEQLRGDRNFLIFLTQCANLIHKIQAKIQLLSSAEGIRRS
ncbi:MAG: hypothetical protein DWQ01_10675 [Planctomycetota bacterium]|nr:MAG: hypothetical protein DWQ01_10675 [Planctomycetota bacterium]